MRNSLKRCYRQGDLHFVTFSGYSGAAPKKSQWPGHPGSCVVDLRCFAGARTLSRQQEVIVNFKIGVVQPSRSEIIRMVPSNQLRDELFTHRVRHIAL